MDTSGESSQAREQPQARTPSFSWTSVLLCTPRAVACSRLSYMWCTTKPKTPDRKFCPGKNHPCICCSTPMLATAGVWQPRLHGVRAPLEEDPSQSNGCFSLFCLFNIILYLILFFYSYNSENEVSMLFCMILLPEGLLCSTNAHRHLHISKAFCLCVYWLKSIKANCCYSDLSFIFTGGKYQQWYSHLGAVLYTMKIQGYLYLYCK